MINWLQYHPFQIRPKHRAIHALDFGLPLQGCRAVHTKYTKLHTLYVPSPDPLSAALCQSARSADA